MVKADYKINPRLRKRMVHKYVLSTKTLRSVPWLIIAYILLFAGIAIALGTLVAMLATQDRIGTVLAGFSAGLLFFVILYIIFFFIRYKTFYNLGAPYSYMSKEFVHLENAGLEFGYHDISAHRTPLVYSHRLKTQVYSSRVNNLDCMTVYQFLFEDITDVKYDPRFMLLTITGRATSLYYNDYTHDQEHYETRDILAAGREFSFILATEHAEEIVRILTDKSKNE